MKQQTTKIMMAMAIAAITFSSCKKDDAGNNNNAADGISGSYKLAAMVQIVGGVEVDYMSNLEECSLDDVLNLKANKTYTYTDAGVACTPNGSDEGVWNTKGADSLLIDGFAVKIVSKTNSQLVLLSDRTADGFDLVFKTTYKKQ